MAFIHLPLRLLLWASLLSIIPLSSAQQQEIECLRPHEMGDGSRPVYDTGESVQFQWKSTWPNFNLTIVQTDSETQQKTRQQTFSTCKEAGMTPGGQRVAPTDTDHSRRKRTEHDFEFYLERRELCWPFPKRPYAPLYYQCGGLGMCDLRLPKRKFHRAGRYLFGYEHYFGFYSNGDLTRRSSTTSAAASSDASDDHLKLGLGLGLGLGIPLLIIITALATWLCARKRRQQRQGTLTAGAYEGSLNPTPSATMPLNSATTYTQPSSTSYVSDPSEKSPTPEMDSHEVGEMQTDNARVEAPQDAVRAELAGDDGMARALYDVKRA